MTATGFLVGILAGIGVLAMAIVAFLIVAVRKMRPESKGGSASYRDGHTGPRGYQDFVDLVLTKLDDAPPQSSVLATFPFPSVETYIQVAGRRAGQTSFRIEIRLGYKRQDHLTLVQNTLKDQKIDFERIDKGNGAIKLRSAKTEDVNELLAVTKSLKSAVMYDLAGNSITVMPYIRSG